MPEGDEVPDEEAGGERIPSPAANGVAAVGAVWVK